MNRGLQEAIFTQLVHQWYKTCDEWGLHPNEWIDRFINMSNFLTEGIQFDDYPMDLTHVRGIPITTYKGILQGISTRIQLYSISSSWMYNNHTISTLGIESFFSSLSKADFTMTGCPRATQIHKILPIMIDYQYHKHDPEKIFKMDNRKGAPYPYYNMEKVTHQNYLTQNEQFKPHNFDIYAKKTKKRIKMNPSVESVCNQVGLGSPQVTSFHWEHVWF